MKRVKIDNASTRIYNMSTPFEAVMKTKICRFFEKNGTCKFGDDCRFSHVKNPKRKKAKNTVTFTPFDREIDLRLVVDTATDKMSVKLRKCDIGIFTNVFPEFKPWQLHDLVRKEIEESSIENLLKPWHGNDKIDGTHLICDDSKSWKRQANIFNMIIDRLCKYFSVSAAATRCNWYKSHTEFKPQHHDASAFDPEKAAKQNITIALSLGQTREILIQKTNSSSAKETKDHKGVFFSFPAPDSSVYTFTNEVNKTFKHGVHIGIEEDDKNKESRISIIIWGWCENISDNW